jgi:Cu-Zn family superoxide dismutase
MFMQILAITTLAMITGLSGFIAMNTRRAETATAELLSGEGKSLGKLTLAQESEGVRISGHLTGLSAGPHAFHIHGVGQCHGPDFKTAGAHFNPYEKKHGTQSKDGPHAGDLPNFTAQADGSAEIDCLAALVTLKTGKNSLLGASGTCLVIHERPDDEMTDPTGNAGNRVACGVIQK